MKTVVITGATSGIGFAAAEEMGARGWNVIGIGRLAEHCEKAQIEIKSLYPKVRIKYFVADLSEQGEVNRVADEVIIYIDAKCGGKIDILVNNAGCVRDWYIATEDGYETQFALNHLAAFLLTYRLLEKLQNAPSGRVLTVSSGSHYNTRINWNDIMHQKHYNCLMAYKQSKLCNVLFTHEFIRRNPEDSNVRAFAVDPGLVNTDIGLKGTGGIISGIWALRKKHGLSPYQAASTIIYLSKMPAGFEPCNAYFKNCSSAKPSRQSMDETSGLRLWELSEKLCGIDSTSGGSGQ
jgi:NAD(P)-dependent dehydrogenase (short-subunit alcohol dehydrogenase family)